MKILFTPSDNNMAGAFQSMVRLCKILQEEYSCDITVLLRTNGPGEELLKDNNIRYVKIKSYNWIVPERPTSNFRRVELLVRTATRPYTQLYNFFAVKKIANFIKKETFDIVHLNTTYIYVSALAALETNTPFVWHLREFLEEDQHKRIWNRKIGYNLISKANAVVAISDSLYNKYIKLIPNANMVRIYNGIDEEYYGVLNHSIFEASIINVAMIGTINESKGQIQAINALNSLVNQGIQNIRLCIVGPTTRYAQGLMAEVERLNLKQYVEFVGQQKDTVTYYKKSDIALVCSRFEAFGRVTVEAMMAGCLVIGADTGGTVELVSNLETGLLYKSGDADDLAEKIRCALNNKKRMIEIARNGQAYMLKNMTARTNAQNIYDIYRTIIQNRKEKNI